MSRTRSSDEQDRVRPCGRFAALVCFAAPRPWMSHGKWYTFSCSRHPPFVCVVSWRLPLYTISRYRGRSLSDAFLPSLFPVIVLSAFADPLDLQFSVRDSAHLYAPSQFAIRINTVNEDGSSLFTPRLPPGTG